MKAVLKVNVGKPNARKVDLIKCLSIQNWMDYSSLNTFNSKMITNQENNVSV